MRSSFFAFLILLFCSFQSRAQVISGTDTISVPDNQLRITNFTPFFTQHSDSLLSYRFQINRDPAAYFWFLRNPPVGLKIDKDNGLLSFKAERSYFLSGKLKYDYEYKVSVVVQSLTNPKDRVDTVFSLQFFNTEIIPSRLKPTIGNMVMVEEGEPVSFKVQCETGSFPIENILFSSSMPIRLFTLVKNCDDEFSWTPDYDFVKETDSARVRIVNLYFIGSNRFRLKDTAQVRIVVKNALNYPQAADEYSQLTHSVQTYLLRLKYSFLQLDKRIRKNRGVRTTFDLTGAATALTGTLLNTSSSENAQKTGKVLPGVGVALVPIKEAASPARVVDQNQAGLIRSSILRIEYMLRDNALISGKDPDILQKITRIKEDMKQIRMQLIDIPIDITNSMTEEELNNYFNSPKVNKKYRIKPR